MKHEHFPFNVFVSSQYRIRHGRPKRVLVVEKDNRELLEAFPGYSWPEGNPADQLHAVLLRIVEQHGRKARKREIDLLFDGEDN